MQSRAFEKVSIDIHASHSERQSEVLRLDEVEVSEAGDSIRPGL